jgi:hypothetical protein
MTARQRRADRYLAQETERARLSKYGLEPRDKQRLERALCTLADYEGPLKQVLCGEIGGHENDHARVCGALRWIVDGE